MTPVPALRCFAGSSLFADRGLLLRFTSRVSLIALLLLLASAAGLAQSSPSDFDAISAQAATALKQQNLSLALRLYTQGVALKPDWAEGWWYIGMLDYTANEYVPAIDAFNHVLKLQPQAVPAMAIRGMCEFDTADYDDALNDLSTAVEHGAANDAKHAPILRYRLGLLLDHAGRFMDALSQYRALAMHGDAGPDVILAIGLAGMRVRIFPKDVSDQDREI